MKTPLIKASLSILLASPGLCQQPLFQFTGALGEPFGRSVAGIGDINGDGRSEIVVGSTLGPQGRVLVYSGLDGALLHEISVGSAEFGASVSAIGDIDGDGSADFLVGDPGVTASASKGRVRLYSGATATLLRSVSGGTTVPAGEHIGLMLAPAGDVDGDGSPDFITGGNHIAAVYSAATGAQLHTFPGGFQAFWHLNTAVAGVGDMDGDGHDDVAVGVYSDDTTGNNAGQVRVYSGSSGALLMEHFGAHDQARFGASVVGIGDVNGDGTPDLAVGAPGDVSGSPENGAVYVYSGSTGSLLFARHADLGMGLRPGLGTSMSATGDANGDAVPDLLVSSYMTQPSTTVLSGVDGTTVHALPNPTGGMSFGYGLAPAGDLDGDGFSEWILGAPMDGSSISSVGAGKVYVFSARVPLQRDCDPAVVNSTGASARIDAQGSNLVGSNHLLLAASSLPPSNVSLLVCGNQPAFLPGIGGSQGTLCLGGAIGRFISQIGSSNAAGAISFDVDLSALPTSPAQSVMVGQTWRFQVWYRDTNPTSTSNLTDAVSILFQ